MALYEFRIIIIIIIIIMIIIIIIIIIIMIIIIIIIKNVLRVSWVAKTTGNDHVIAIDVTYAVQADDLWQ